MKILNKLADRVLTRVVSSAGAQAACTYSTLKCIEGTRYRCWYNRCDGSFLGCTIVSYNC